MEVAGESRSLVPAGAPCLLPVRWHFLHICAGLGKFGSPSEDDPTIFYRRCRGKSASGMVRSEDLRVIYCMASETSVGYFVC